MYQFILLGCEAPFAINFSFKILMSYVCTCVPTHHIYTHTYTCIYTHTHICIPTYIHSGVGFLICRARAASALLDTAKLSPKVVMPIYIPISNVPEFLASISSPKQLNIFTLADVHS